MQETKWLGVRLGFCLGSLEWGPGKEKVVSKELGIYIYFFGIVWEKGSSLQCRMSSHFHTQSFELRFKLLGDAGKVNVSTCNPLYMIYPPPSLIN